eukprot:2706022-Rhodomonas_salina.1
MKSPTNSHKPVRSYSRLTPAQVLEVFSLRPARSEDQTFVPATDLCHRLAKHYNVCDRAIRDVWSRRSWGSITRAMWTDAEVAADPSTCGALDSNTNVVPAKDRPRGRPHGAKDTVQRARNKRAVDTSSSCAETCVRAEEGSTLAQQATASAVENKMAALESEPLSRLAPEQGWKVEGRSDERRPEPVSRLTRQQVLQIFSLRPARSDKNQFF